MQTTARPGHLIKEDHYQSSEIKIHYDSAEESTRALWAESGWKFLVHIPFDGSISGRAKVSHSFTLLGLGLLGFIYFFI